jgi:hypothetical protein
MSGSELAKSPPHISRILSNTSFEAGSRGTFCIDDVLAPALPRRKLEQRISGRNAHPGSTVNLPYPAVLCKPNRIISRCRNPVVSRVL